MTKRKQVLSGIQPTGQLHFGNYFGAIKNWLTLQNDYDCIYGVVDYHAMTMPYQAAKLRESSWELIFNLLACGVRAEYLFIQSMIPEHTELGWILGCFTSYGELSRMTQFKDKSVQSEGSADGFISSGLFTYPVLQAADILIYHADYVPVGKDQDQHLELTRNIAQRFNNFVGKEYFVMPETLHTEVPRVMSLAAPDKKMSKSLGDKHVVGLLEDEASIRKKIKSAVTDAGSAPNEMAAGVRNLFDLLKAAEAHEAYHALLLSAEQGTLKYSDLKEAVANALVAISNEVKPRKAELLANKRAVKEQIQDAAAVIRKQAQKTLREVRDISGLTALRP